MQEEIHHSNPAAAEEDDEEIMIPITTLTKISNYIDRYFLRFYKIYSGPEGQCLNQYAFQHTNKLCLVGLAREHEIIALKKKVTKISYDKVYVGDMQKMVKGKKKKGGVKAHINNSIAEIFCDDGSIYDVKGVIEGSIIELNDNLLANPSWITEFPEEKGFIGIINIGKKAKLENRDILDAEDYKKVLSGEDISLIKEKKSLKSDENLSNEEIEQE